MPPLRRGAANLNSLWEYDGWAEAENGGIYFEGGGKTDWGRSFAFWKDEVGLLYTLHAVDP